MAAAITFNLPGKLVKKTGSPWTVALQTRHGVASDGLGMGQRHTRRVEREQRPANALVRSMVSSGELGSHRGLPVSIIVTTTLSNLENKQGVGGVFLNFRAISGL